MKKGWYDYKSSNTGDKKTDEWPPKDSGAIATPKPKADSYDGNKTGDKKGDGQLKDYGATATPKPKADSYDKTGDKKKDVWPPKDSGATPKPTDSYDGYKTGDKKKVESNPKDSVYGSGHSDWNQGYDDCVQRELWLHYVSNKVDLIVFLSIQNARLNTNSHPQNISPHLPRTAQLRVPHIPLL